EPARVPVERLAHRQCHGDGVRADRAATVALAAASLAAASLAGCPRESEPPAAWSAPPAPAGPMASAPAPLSERERGAGGATVRGQALYEVACAKCHGAEGTGTALGVNIADRPLLFRAAEFAEVVRKGRGRMPAAAQASDADVAGLLAFLRGTAPKKTG